MKHLAKLVFQHVIILLSIFALAFFLFVISVGVAEHNIKEVGKQERQIYYEGYQKAMSDCGDSGIPSIVQPIKDVGHSVWM